MTERLAIIGNPIGHTLSPAMQNAAIVAAGLDWTYAPERVASVDLAATVNRFRAERYQGFNVTVPHKVAVVPLLDALDVDAQRVGAVNTVVRQGDLLVGNNTDLAGFRAALSLAAGTETLCRAVLFGAGGAARAVLAVLDDLNISTVIVNRTPARAEALACTVSEATCMTLDDPRLADVMANAELLVNATSLGWEADSESSPLPADARLRPDTLVMDLVYGRETPFLCQAAAQDCRVSDGLEMLVAQGAAAFRLWTGVVPDIAVMRAACLAALMEVQTC